MRKLNSYIAVCSVCVTQFGHEPLGLLKDGRAPCRYCERQAFYLVIDIESSKPPVNLVA